MSRYIDADKLIADWMFISKAEKRIIDNQPTADVVDRDKAQKEIDYWHDKAQSYEQTIAKLTLNQADVVEVVRCKDCKYDHKCSHNIIRPSKGGGIIYCPLEYCSEGERKDE